MVCVDCVRTIPFVNTEYFKINFQISELMYHIEIFILNNKYEISTTGT